MISIQGEEKKVQLWVGASLKGFGENPYGEPLFRVVWAPSRYYLFGGKHNERNSKAPTDRELLLNGGRDISINRVYEGYKWIPMYPAKRCYVLEKWLSPVEFAGAPEMWEFQQRDAETGMLQLGPYPSRGEYFYMDEFADGGYPVASAVEALIKIKLKGRQMTYDEIRRAMLAIDERERLELVQKRKEIILDSQPAFGFNPTNVHTAKKKPEDIKLKYSTKDLAKRGMPVGQNKIFTKSQAGR